MTQSRFTVEQVAHARCLANRRARMPGYFAAVNKNVAVTCR